MEEPKKEKPSQGIWSKFMSVTNWKKYPLVMTTMFLIVLWRTTSVTLENKIEELERSLNRCQEARTMDAKERTSQDRRVLDRYIDQSLQRSADRIIKPKIDSIGNL